MLRFLTSRLWLTPPHPTRRFLPGCPGTTPSTFLHSIEHLLTCLAFTTSLKIKWIDKAHHQFAELVYCPKLGMKLPLKLFITAAMVNTRVMQAWANRNCFKLWIYPIWTSGGPRLSSFCTSPSWEIYSGLLFFSCSKPTIRSLKQPWRVLKSWRLEFMDFFFFNFSTSCISPSWEIYSKLLFFSCSAATTCS